MNLQLALIILGIVLIALIYLVSRHFDKKGHISRIGTDYSDKNDDHDFDENDESTLDCIKLEQSVAFSLEILFQIKNRTKTDNSHRLSRIAF